MAIELQVRSDSRQARQDLARLNRSVESINTRTANAARNIGRLATAAAASFAALGGGAFLAGAADQLTNLENRVATVTGRTQEMVDVTRQLRDITRATRGEIGVTAETFGRLGRALGVGTAEARATSEEVLRATRVLNQAVAISGATTNEAAGALRQLGQGLAAEALRGQELNSVLEQTPRIAQLIAAELGVAVGQLRGLAEQGALTSDVVFGALLNQADQINREFVNLNATVGQSSQVFGQALQEYAANLDRSLGISQSLINGLLSSADSLRAASQNVESSVASIRAFFSAISNLGNSVQRALSAIARSIVDFLGLGPAFDAIARAAGNALRPIREFFSFSFNLGGATASINAMADGIDRFATRLERGSGPLASVLNFTDGVTSAFRDTYIAVVGGSYWPDLVDGVIDYARRIGQAFGPIGEFASRVTGAFLQLSLLQQALVARGALGALVGFGGIFRIAAIGATALTAALTLGIIELEDITDALDGAGDAFRRFTNNAGSIVLANFDVRSIVSEIGSALTAIVATPIASLLADAISGAFTIGVNIIEPLAGVLGRVAGIFVAQFIGNIPAIAFSLGSALAEAGQQFIRGFLQQIPLIGDALSGTFNIFNTLTGGLAGLIGGGLLVRLFFGSFGPSALIARITDVFSIVRGLFAALAGRDAVAQSGALGQFLFGGNGANGFRALLAQAGTLIVAAFGRFRGLISRIAEGGFGLIGTMITGPAGPAAAVASARATATAAAASAESAMVGAGNRIRARFPGGLIRTALYGASIAALFASTSAFASDLDGAVSTGGFGTLISYAVDGGLIAASLFGVGGLAALSGTLATIGATIVSVIFAPITLALAAVAGVGVLGLYLFGRGDSFFERISDASLRIANMVGLLEHFVDLSQRGAALSNIVGNTQTPDVRDSQLIGDAPRNAQDILSGINFEIATPDEFSSFFAASVRVREAEERRQQILDQSFRTDQEILEANRSLVSAVERLEDLQSDLNDRLIERAGSAIRGEDGSRDFLEIERTFFEGVRLQGARFVDGVGEVLDGVASSVATFLFGDSAGDTSNLVTGAIGRVYDAINGAIQSAIDSIAAIPDQISSFLFGDEDSTALTQLQLRLNQIRDAINGFINSIIGVFTDIEMAIFGSEGIAGVFAAEGAVGVISDTISAMGEFLGRITNLFTSLLNVFSSGRDATPRDLNAAGIDPNLAGGFQVGSNGQLAVRFQNGGSVSGPGGPRDDAILARLSNGEFVVNARAASRYRGLLEMINNGEDIPGYQNGGSVGGGFFSSISDSFSSAGNAISGIEAITTQVQAIFPQVERLIDNLNYIVERVEPILGTVPQLILNVEQTIARFIPFLDSLNPVVDQLESSISELQPVIASVPGIVEQASGGLGQASATLTSLEPVISQIPSVLTSVQLGILDAVGVIPQVSTTLDNVNGTLNSLEGPISQLPGVLANVGEIAQRVASGDIGLAGRQIFGSRADGGQVQAFNTGGRVRGPGTGRSDDIPAYLSNGEFVVNAEATRRNLPLLAAINGGNYDGFGNEVGLPRGYQTGGLALRRGARSTPDELYRATQAWLSENDRFYRGDPGPLRGTAPFGNAFTFTPSSDFFRGSNSIQNIFGISRSTADRLLEAMRSARGLKDGGLASFVSGGLVNANSDIIRQIVAEEGFSATPYLDSLGLPTIGYGRLLANRRLTEAELAQQYGTLRETPAQALQNAIDYVNNTAVPDARNFVGSDVYNSLPANVQSVLISSAYNLGASRLGGFSGFRADLQRGDLTAAAFNLLDSRAATQAVFRYGELAQQLIAQGSGQLRDIPARYLDALENRRAQGLPIPHGYEQYLSEVMEENITGPAPRPDFFSRPIPTPRARPRRDLAQIQRIAAALAETTTPQEAQSYTSPLQSTINDILDFVQLGYAIPRFQDGGFLSTFFSQVEDRREAFNGRITENLRERQRRRPAPELPDAGGILNSIVSFFTDSFEDRRSAFQGNPTQRLRDRLRTEGGRFFLGGLFQNEGVGRRGRLFSGNATDEDIRGARTNRRDVDLPDAGGILSGIVDYITGQFDRRRSLFGEGRLPDGYADGGRVRGPGTGRSDSILARLSNGEFVVNAAATRQNLGLLQAINNGGVPGFQTGGLAGRSRTQGAGSSFDLVENADALAAALQRAVDSADTFAQGSQARADQRRLEGGRITLGDAQGINELFDRLNRLSEEFGIGLSDSVQANIGGIISQIENATQIGAQNGFDEVQIAAFTQGLADGLRDALQGAIASIELRELTSRVSEALNIDAVDAALLPESTLNMVNALVNNLEDANDAFNSATTPQELREAAAEIRDIQGQLANSIGTSRDRINQNLSDAGVGRGGLSDQQFAGLSPAQFENINGLTAAIAANQQRITDLNGTNLAEEQRLTREIELQQRAIQDLLTNTMDIGSAFRGVSEQFRGISQEQFTLGASNEDIERANELLQRRSEAERELNSGQELSIERRRELTREIQAVNRSLQTMGDSVRRSVPAIDQLRDVTGGITQELSATLSQQLAQADFTNIGQTVRYSLLNSIQSRVQQGIEEDLNTIFDYFTDTLFNSLQGSLGSGAGGGLGGGGGSGIFSAIGGLFGGGGGGGGGFFGGLFHEGGIVPGNGGNVPIIASGGEAVLTREQQRSLFAGNREASNSMGSGGGNVTNINISGNVDERAIQQIRQVISSSPDMVGSANGAYSDNTRGIRSRNS